VIDGVVERFEDSIGEPVLAHELPDILLLSSGARGGNSRSEMLAGILSCFAPSKPA
jgi:hypothetical protein